MRAKRRYLGKGKFRPGTTLFDLDGKAYLRRDEQAEFTTLDNRPATHLTPGILKMFAVKRDKLCLVPADPTSV